MSNGASRRSSRAVFPAEPLTVPVLHILLALADEDRHGLGIADHVEAFTHGRLSLGPGTLYGAIKRLLESGLIKDVPQGARPGHDDPRRRYYHLTAAGRRAVEAESQALARLVSVARLKRVVR
jgi:DNA-binding PadR family transcriptional regulator